MLGNRTNAISARISGNAKKEKISSIPWTGGTTVASAGLGLANQNQLAWEASMVADDALSDSTEEGMAVEIVKSRWSVDSSSKTPRRTLELARRIEKRPVRMLIDSSVIGNYVSA